MTAANDMIIMGRISGLFGVKGWLKVYSDTEPRENILNYSPWYLEQDGQWRAYELQAGKRHGKGVIAHLADCPDRDAAAALVGLRIAVKRAQLPETEKGEYYWSDLKGLRVVTMDGVDLGVVTHLMETGANDVLVVRAERGAEQEQAQPRERLIPFLQGDVIVEVDLEGGLMKVDWDPAF